MSNDVLIQNEEVRIAKTDVDPQALLDILVESVKRDSRKEAIAFLAETTVPHGGE